jgi:two-component system sensor histidine kinase TrcS
MTRLARIWQSWTLTRQLVVGMAAVVMVVLLTVGTLTVLTLRASVLGLTDAQLSASADGFSNAVTKYRITPTPSGDQPPPGAMKPLTQLIGQAPGNVLALIQDGKVVDSAFFADGEARAAPPAAVQRIAELSWTGAEPRTIELPELGFYRMVSRPGEGGEVLVTGASWKPAWEAVTRETAIVAGMTALALLITALCTIAIVRFALRPLGRVAATAAEVATLPLDRENHTIAPRVQASDTDPRTEVGAVGETLNRLLDHVEGALAERAASDRRMRQFITDVSHELRTPLAAIQGYAELTRQDSPVLPDTTEYSLARIEAEAKRMGSLVSDLLLLARLDEGQDLEIADVDLAEVVADAVHDARVSAPTHRWLHRVPRTGVWVHGDRARLHQLLANLLSNAGMHTPPGTTVTTAITERATNGTEYAELTVTDDGPGIDRELLPHLFERFVRADKSRSRQSGSAGLGLSIAASIVEAHDGAITAESVCGQTTFAVRFPVVIPQVSSSHRASRTVGTVS